MHGILAFVWWLVAAFTCPSQAPNATNLSGSWQAEVTLRTADGQSNLLSVRAELVQDGVSLAGTIGPTNEFRLREGRVNGSRIVFTAAMPVRQFCFDLSQTGSGRFEGTVRSDDGKAAGGIVMTRASTAAMPRSDASDEILAIINGSVIDGTGRAPLLDAVVVVRAGKIETVGKRSIVGVPRGAKVLDAAGGTVLPGFINAHVHDAFSARNLETWARAGVTTVRDEGIIGRGSLATRLQQREQWARDARYARLVSSGRMIAAPGGYGTLFVGSPDEARRAVMDEVAAGVDLIKLSIEDGYGQRSDLPLMPADTVAAIVTAAHAAGKPVSVHVTEAVFLKRALDMGADDIGHVTWDQVDEPTLRRLAERRTVVTPTVTVFEAYGAGAGALATLRRMARAGVKLALGNDYTDVPQNGFPNFELGMPMFEIRKMAEAGLSSMEIIVAATRNAAEVCRLAETLGTLEAGKAADILVVDGNPLKDLEALARPRWVVHGGVVIRAPQNGVR